MRKANVQSWVGQPAPVFELADENGKLVKLSDYLGRQPVVLIFYPGDDTPGCTKQLCAIRDDAKEFAKLKIAVFGVNPGSRQSHFAFKHKYGLTAKLLVDEGKRVAQKYGAIKKFFKAVIVKRTVVAIGKSGKIIYYQPGLPENAEILNALKKPQS
ncbi:peroxiredoxin [Candidatus Parcubacteria bacterium]|jgi:peroxiredoxin Q/BCP|nr:MAG: peroxiredoxin [Candidatus Parcubacteria bacterium]